MSIGAGLIAVLGAPNDDRGVISEIAESRCALAAKEYDRMRRPIIPTGGFGEHFNVTRRPHHEYLRRRLLELGVRAGDIWDGIGSTNTQEDVTLLGQLLESASESVLTVVTSDFHTRRVEVLFSLLAPPIAVHVIGAVTSLPAEDRARLENHERKALSLLRRLEKGSPAW